MNEPTNLLGLTIKAWDGSIHDLSDQIYEILDGDHPSFQSGYGKGDLVRLIRMRDERGKRLKIGEHSFARDMVVVSNINRSEANFCGVKKKSLREVT